MADALATRNRKTLGANLNGTVFGPQQRGLTHLAFPVPGVNDAIPALLRCESSAGKTAEAGRFHSERQAQCGLNNSEVRIRMGLVSQCFFAWENTA